MIFADRRQAGRELARRLERYAGRRGLLVLGLARGGVPVAYEVAKALDAPLDVFVVRKLGLSGQPELALGAIASGGSRVINEPLVRRLGVSPEELVRTAREQAAELERRETACRGEVPPIDPLGRSVILVDDGAATGASLRASARAVRRLAPSRLVLATPVSSPDACDELGPEADEVVCLQTPSSFTSVGQWYEDFEQVPDSDVRALLERSRREWGGADRPQS